MKKIERLLGLFLLMTAVAFTGCDIFDDEEEDDEKLSLSFVEENMSYTPYNGVNPLKGFMSWAGSSANSFEYSMEYIPLKLNQVLVGENLCDFTAVETALEECRGRRHQAVIRFLIDEPNAGLYLPDYMEEKGVPVFSYSYEGSSGKSPDYNNSYFLSQISYFIEQFAEKYDGDPRIASIQTGIIGHWGEQHIYLVENSAGYEEKWDVSGATWKSFFEVWGKSFVKTKLSTRNPSLPGHKGYDNIGYYHDMICSESDDAYFDELLENSNANQMAFVTSTITGEIAPGLQAGLLDSLLNIEEPSGVAAKYFEDIGKYNVSGALFAELFDRNDSAIAGIKENLMTAQSKMGYDLRVTAARVKAQNSKVKMGVFITNAGVAPLPYKWEIELCWYDGSKIAYRFATDWDITWISSPAFEEMFSITVPYYGGAGKEYTLLMRIINPMEGGLPVKFSNKSQDSVIDGYITLGKIKF